MTDSVPCFYPFTSINVGPGGDVWFCCPEWTTSAAKTRLGNLKSSTIGEMWNGDVAIAIREAMYAQEEQRFCRKPGCPIMNGQHAIRMDSLDSQFRGDLFDPIAAHRVQAGNPWMAPFPSYVVISNDWRCNLRCVMCGTTQFSEQYGHRDAQTAYITEKLFDELDSHRHHIRRIFLAGYGDPFAIKRHLAFMRDKANRGTFEIELLTNGMLLTPKMWETISHNRFQVIRISIDAATEATYRKIRRRGNWKKLLENLRFIGTLRRAQEIPAFEINMTVMRDNYREVYDFLDFGLELGCDCIGLQIIHGDLGGQNFLQPKIDWSVVEYLQTFLQSAKAQHPRYYTDFLHHLLSLKRPVSCE